MSIQAMKQALEALSTARQRVQYMINNGEWYTPEKVVDQADEAITSLRAAIEAAEKQKPVAWMGEYNINDIRDHYTVVMRHKTDFDGMPERVRALVFKEDLQK